MTEEKLLKWCVQWEWAETYDEETFIWHEDDAMVFAPSLSLAFIQGAVIAIGDTGQDASPVGIRNFSVSLWED